MPWHTPFNQPLSFPNNRRRQQRDGLKVVGRPGLGMKKKKNKTRGRKSLYKVCSWRKLFF
jgi:hypothetical protein